MPFRSTHSLPLPLPLLLETMKNSSVDENENEDSESNIDKTGALMKNKKPTFVMNVTSVALGFYHSSFLLSAVPYDCDQSAVENDLPTVTSTKKISKSEQRQTQSVPSSTFLSSVSFASKLLHGLAPLRREASRLCLMNDQIVPVLSSIESVSSFNSRCAFLSSRATTNQTSYHQQMMESNVHTPAHSRTSVESTPLRPLTKLTNSEQMSQNTTPARTLSTFATPRLVSISFASGSESTPATPLVLSQQLAGSIEESRRGIIIPQSSSLVHSILAEERSASLSNEHNPAMPVQPLVRTRSLALSAACAPIY
jgi:hypothetical protein